MSAPDSDLEKQAKRHRGPLRGMFAMVLWSLVLLVGLAIFVVSRGGSPEGADTQVQTGVGLTGDDPPVEGLVVEDADPGDVAVVPEQ